MSKNGYPAESLPAEIFKAYDIRGIVDETLTEDGARAIGHAVGSMASEAGEKLVATGRDGRLSGPRLRSALAQGIMAAGLDVIDLGAVPTPLVYFAANVMDTTSGVAVTGSHNPPQYNGLKIVVGGHTLSGDDIQNLRKRAIAGDLTHGQGTERSYDIQDDYLNRIAKDIKLDRPLKAVVDAGNGVAGEIAPKVLRAIGCEVDELYCEIDGNFPNHHPDPTQLENLVDLIARVQELDADIGLGFDGDGDRLGVVTKEGKIIWPDRQMILFARDILGRNPGAEIVFDVKCSRTLPAEIAAAGGKPTMWKTGHSLIKAQLKKSGAAIAGEMSGHIFFSERWYGFDDGVYSAARLLEILSATDESPVDVFAKLPDTVNTPELKLEMDREGEHHELVAELIEAADFSDANVSNIDGLRVDFDDGFGLVRGSNTTPTIVMRFEADDQTALERIQNRFRDLINTTRPGLTLPF